MGPDVCSERTHRYTAVWIQKSAFSQMIYHNSDYPVKWFRWELTLKHHQTDANPVLWSAEMTSWEKWEWKGTDVLYDKLKKTKLSCIWTAWEEQCWIHYSFVFFGSLWVSNKQKQHKCHFLRRAVSVIRFHVNFQGLIKVWKLLFEAPLYPTWYTTTHSTS